MDTMPLFPHDMFILLQYLIILSKLEDNDYIYIYYFPKKDTAFRINIIYTLC